VRVVFIGEERECAGFKLGGVEVVPVSGESDFKEKVEFLISDETVGILVVSDRYYDAFLVFAERLKKRARPIVVFVPSFDGIHLKRDLKEFLYGILGIG